MDKALEHRESKRLVESVALQRHGHKRLTSTKNGSERTNHWQHYRKKIVTWHLYNFHFHFWNLLFCHFRSSLLSPLINMHNIFQPRGYDLPMDPFCEWLTWHFLIMNFSPNSSTLPFIHTEQEDNFSATLLFCCSFLFCLWQMVFSKDGDMVLLISCVLEPCYFPIKAWRLIPLP